MHSLAGLVLRLQKTKIAVERSTERQSRGSCVLVPSVVPAPSASGARRAQFQLAYRLFRGGEVDVQFPCPLLVSRIRHGNQRWDVAALLGVDALLVDTVEEGEEL